MKANRQPKLRPPQDPVGQANDLAQRRALIIIFAISWAAAAVNIASHH